MDKLYFATIMIPLMILSALSVYTVYRDATIRKEKQEFDMLMIKAQSKARVTTSYDDAFRIVDKMLTVSTITAINSLNLKSKTPEQLSVILDDVIIEVSTHVLINISDTLKQQMYNYITEDFLTKYVTDNCRRLLVINIEGDIVQYQKIQKDDKKI